LYKTQEFAQLAGITVKALRHYGRLGLMKPARSGAGYRMYTDRDLERLEQILALKFLGLPLKDIAAALDRTALALPDALRSQRRALEEKQELLARAIRVIRAAEEAIQPGQPADAAILKTIIEVIHMQDAVEAMKQYYSAGEWEKRRRYYEEGPSEEWQALYRDANALLDADPGSDAVQALADRWLALTVRAASGDPAVQQDSMKAWQDREHWPEAIKQRIAEFHLEEVTELIRQAALSSRKKYFSAEAWSKLVEMRRKSGQLYTGTWQARVDLFEEAEAALGDDPAGARGQRLAARWRELLLTESAGDPAIRAGLVKWWADRANWAANLRWWTEGLHRMTGERFDCAADYLERAVEAEKNRHIHPVLGV
jgi:DNA-binding transcriptional MerR regulator